MDDKASVESLITETEIDSDSLAVECALKTIHEICERRGWPAGAMCIVDRGKGVVSALGTIQLVRDAKTKAMLASAEDSGLKLALIIEILTSDIE